MTVSPQIAGVVTLRAPAYVGRRLVRRAPLVAVLLGTWLAGSPAVAQVIHLPPAHRRVLSPNITVLTVAAKTDDFKKATVLVDDDQVVIRHDGRMVVVPLGDRLIRDVMNQLTADVGAANITVTSDYPLYPAAYLGSRGAKPLSAQGGVKILANADEPDVRIGFGVVLALAEPNADRTDGGILAQTGFQLDVVGTHQVIGPGRSDPQKRSEKFRAALPITYTQWRFGLNADQQIQLDEKEDPQTSLASQQFEQALGQADQVALSGQLDIELFSGKRFAAIVSPTYAVSWTRLQPHLRVDASESIGGGNTRPLLRVLLARAFPVGN
jgi:hypothetical protein